MTKRFLYIQNGNMRAVREEEIKNEMAKNNVTMLKALSKLINPLEPPICTYTDLENGLTIISDDEGLYAGNDLYSITDKNGIEHFIPGTIIFAKLGKDNCTEGLTEEDYDYMKKHIQIRYFNLNQHAE